ncbi:MAG: FAD binding domain-containing protein [Oscillospiraceae bacterium]|nr:FAD binding domain-containing protein [Oscillospiraceae bacterium]
MVSNIVENNAMFAPTSLVDALELLKDGDLIPYSGGTDIMVSGTCEQSRYLFINNIPELHQITSDDEYIRFGATCTFSDTIASPHTPTILKETCSQVAAPAIRNAGTLGGNIANGSAKADSALIFMVTDSKLRLVSASGERVLPIKDFYLGGGKTALAPGELIVEILMPKHGIYNYYYTKVGARNALAIARTSFAGILDVDSDNKTIKNLAVAFGAVKDTIIRQPEIDKMLIGKSIEEAKEFKDTYISAYNEAIIPRPGRVSVEFRKTVCMNLLRDFLDMNGV